jgi:hypothetical protein
MTQGGLPASTGRTLAVELSRARPEDRQAALMWCESQFVFATNALAAAISGRTGSAASASATASA